LACMLMVVPLSGEPAAIAVQGWNITIALAW
jgi:hypothetical protein